MSKLSDSIIESIVGFKEWALHSKERFEKAQKEREEKQKNNHAN